MLSFHIAFKMDRINPHSTGNTTKESDQQRHPKGQVPSYSRRLKTIRICMCDLNDAVNRMFVCAMPLTKCVETVFYLK